MEIVDLDTQVPVAVSEEEIAVFAWRAETLERAGYSPAVAAELAECSYVDLHLAVRLLERGCPAETATRILF